MFVSLNTCNEFSETHALFAGVTVMIEWSMHAHRPTLAHVLVVRSAFGGAVISERRERQTTTIQFLCGCTPRRSYFDSASLVVVALEHSDKMKNSSGSQFRKYQ